MHYIQVKDAQKVKWKKKAKLKKDILIFLYTIYLATLQVHTQFEDPGSNRSREISNKMFCWKEKSTNEGIDKQYVAESLIHSTTCHAQALYQISKS